MKKITKSLLRRIFCKSVYEWIAQLECFIAVRWVSSAHRRLMSVQWDIPPTSEHFDHHIDLFYKWLYTKNPLWLERGVFGSLALQGGGNVLDLACGDGFNARNFYSLRSKHVVACDFDPKAIKTAKRKNIAPNIDYILADIRSNMPNGKFENVTWDAAIEHFTLSEIEQIMRNIKSRLTSNGIFSGYTIVGKPEGKSFSHHEYEFQNKEDLLRFLMPYFKTVTVF